MTEKESLRNASVSLIRRALSYSKIYKSSGHTQKFMI
jgi:hypothetical protein